MIKHVGSKFAGRDHRFTSSSKKLLKWIQGNWPHLQRKINHGSIEDHRSRLSQTWDPQIHHVMRVIPPQNGSSKGKSLRVPGSGRRIFKAIGLVVSLGLNFLLPNRRFWRVPKSAQMSIGKTTFFGQFTILFLFWVDKISHFQITSVRTCQRQDQETSLQTSPLLMIRSW